MKTARQVTDRTCHCCCVCCFLPGTRHLHLTCPKVPNNTGPVDRNLYISIAGLCAGTATPFHLHITLHIICCLSELSRTSRGSTSGQKTLLNLTRLLRQIAITLIMNPSCTGHQLSTSSTSSPAPSPFLHAN